MFRLFCQTLLTVVVEDGHFHDGDAAENDAIAAVCRAERRHFGADRRPLGTLSRVRHQTQLHVELFIRFKLVVVDHLDLHLPNW